MKSFLKVVPSTETPKSLYGIGKEVLIMLVVLFPFEEQI